MFGRKKSPTVVPVAPLTPGMSDEDRELLTDLAHELMACIECSDGAILLEDADEASVCTMPVPILEVCYPGFTVEWTPTVHRFGSEEVQG